MKSHINRILPTLLIVLIPILTACPGGGPPAPGREISFPDQGVSISLADGWEAEVIGTDWSTWERIQKGRTDEPWVFPPVTATHIGAGAIGQDMRYRAWRFKGVEGVFDQTVNPLTSQYPVPPGLWSLDPQKLDLIQDSRRPLEWPSLNGIEATTRLYENTHGMSPNATLWHTYTVIFVVEGNTYEFVMSIPDQMDPYDWIEEFWKSVEDVQISE